jgi:hypothetical protein
MEHHYQQSDLPVRSRPRRSFEYTPLKHRVVPIRLIQILEHRSSEGYISCNMKHASTDDSYTCLSYVWGTDDPKRPILIDGRSCSVRHNLHDFLRMARRSSRLLREWIWIDALCINQHNVTERNYSVQNMGLIYSRATEVISWLGRDGEIADYLETFSESRHDGLNRFLSSEYWERAWITQEVALAHRVTLCAGTSQLDAKRLGGDIAYRSHGKRILNQLPPRTHALQGRSLIYLLDHFGQKQSGIPRDRIYSLLALCDDGSDLQVDYDMSDEKLARYVLRCCKRSFCLCAIRTVTQVLQLHSTRSIDPNTSKSPRGTLFARMNLPVIRRIISQRTCSAQTCQRRDCDGTPRSHDPGFAIRSSTTPGIASIRFDLDQICERGKLFGLNYWRWLNIDLDAGCPGFTFQLVNESSINSDHRTTHCRTEGCDVILSDDRNNCTVRFSFDFLLELSELYAHSGCCARVVNVGTDSEGSSIKPILRLIHC